MAEKKVQYPEERRRQWSGRLPFLLPLFVLATLAIIIYAGNRQILGLAENLSREDAVVMNWWQLDQRERLNASAGMLAARVATADGSADPANFAQMVEDAGLADHPGYIAWIDGEKSVVAEINAAAKVGDPAANKLFSFVPAVGAPAGDFWQEGDLPYWMSMAPINPALGGGTMVIQRPVDEAALAGLAEVTGREVMYYAYEGQQPLVSSDPSLVSDPPALDPVWMNQVAAGQLPAAVQAKNSQGAYVVSLLAFPDFAGLSYTGFLAFLEPAGDITSLLPVTAFWVAALLATLIMLIGAFLLARMFRNFMAGYRTMQYRERRTAKRGMILLTLAFLIPTFLAAFYIVVTTSNASAALDLRTSRIAKDVLIGSTADMTARVNRFAEQATAQTLAAESPEALADLLVRAHGLEYAVISDGENVVQVGVEELSEDALAMLDGIGSGAVDVVTAGKLVMLAGSQPAPDGATAVGGMRLNRQLSRMNDIAEAELSVLNEHELVATTLVDREIESLYFDETVEAALQEDGEADYMQKVGWNAGKLNISGMDIGEPLEWRLLVSQPSITWSNSVRAYQGLAIALLATLLLAVGLVLTDLLNQDNPLLLRRIYTGYMFLMPAVIWLVWWQLGPALFTFYLSFHKWSVLSPAKPFVGLHNYQQIMGDEKFWNAMWNTFIYVLQIPIGMAIALALAMALNRPLRGIKALRTIYYMPAVTSIVVVSLMWKLLYNKDLGIFNYLLSFFGLGPYGFLQSTTMALPSIMFMAIWLGLGARMLLFLAGLQGIPDDLYEAADVDGASGWRKFLHITLPLLAPTTFFVFITGVILSFQIFGPVYVMTQGGPAGATDVAVHRIYFEAWQNLRFGYASAETVILFLILFVATAVQLGISGGMSPMASDNMLIDDQPRVDSAVAAPAATSGRSLWSRVGRITVYVLMAFLAFTTLFPFYFMANTSLMSFNEAFSYPPHLYPPNPKWSNYIDIWSELPFARFFLNSAIHVVGVIAGRFFLVTMAGYAFARIDFPGRDKVFLAFLAFMMIPNAVTLVSSFIILQNMGWIDTYWALIVPWFNYVWGIFLMRQYFMTLPVSLEDAARIDGASELGVYFRIFMPLAKPALLVVVLFTFSDVWKAFLWPLIVTRSIEMRTVEVGIALLQNQYASDFPLQMTAATLVALPIIILFFLAQEYFLEGINLAGTNK